MNLQRAAYKFKVGPYKIIPVEKKRCESTKRRLQLQDAALQYTSGLWHVPLEEAGWQRLRGLRAAILKEQKSASASVFH